eukprot:516530-Pyramimonas_sp.AAC.1
MEGNAHAQRERWINEVVVDESAFKGPGPEQLDRAEQYVDVVHDNGQRPFQYVSTYASNRGCWHEH